MFYYLGLLLNVCIFDILPKMLPALTNAISKNGLKENCKQLKKKTNP